MLIQVYFNFKTKDLLLLCLKWINRDVIRIYCFVCLIHFPVFLRLVMKPRDEMLNKDTMVCLLIQYALVIYKLIRQGNITVDGSHKYTYKLIAYYYIQERYFIWYANVWEFNVIGCCQNTHLQIKCREFWQSDSFSCAFSWVKQSLISVNRKFICSICNDEKH